MTIKKIIPSLLICFVFVGLSNAQTQTERQERDFRIRMTSQFSFDGAHYFNLENGVIDENGNPFMTGGVEMRRLRIGARADYGDWESLLVLELANGVPALRDAFARYSGLQNFEFKIGQFREDFSMEEITSSRNLLFLERPMVVNAFAPSRHLGIQVQWQQFNFLRATAGVSWHTALSASDNAAVQNLRRDGNPIGTNFTGRIVWMPRMFWTPKGAFGLHVGYSFSYRSAQRAGAYNAANFSSRNATSVNRTVFLATDEILGVSHDFLHGFELAAVRRGFRFQGEFIMSNTIWNGIPTEVPTIARDQRFYGWYVQVSHLLFGGHQRYSTSRGVFTAPTRGRSWGDIEVAARFDYLNLNSADINGGSGHNISFGVTYHMNRHVRMMLNYQISRNTIGTSNPRYSDMRGPDVRFNTIQARLEVAF